MAKTSKNIKLKKKNYITGLKELSKWFFSKRIESELKDLIEKYEFDSSILKRLVSYTYNYPHIVWYINKYMNNIYSFQKFNIIDIMYTFGYLLDINQRNQSRKLYYLKSTDLVDKNKQKVKDLLSIYFEKIYDIKYNDSELNFFYDLVTLEKIPLNTIIDIDNFINPGDKTIDISFEKSQINTNISSFNLVTDIYRPLPEKINKFCNELKTQIFENEECKKCELYGKPSIILDTNAEDFEKIDIAFIGLTSGVEDVKIGKPFTDKAGDFLRKNIALLPQSVKWLMFNIIFCHVKNEKDIKSIGQVIQNCSNFMIKILDQFPTKYFISLGAKTSAAFGKTDSITSISGKKFTTDKYVLIPMIHPLSAVNYGQMDKFTKDFKTILDEFSNKIETDKLIPKKENYQINKIDKIIENINTSNTIPSNATFFDVREIGNKIIKIFIDENGKKYYITEDYKINFNIKFGDWKNCNQIVDNIDYIVSIEGKEKTNITSKVRDKLNIIKRGVN